MRRGHLQRHGDQTRCAGDRVVARRWTRSSDAERGGITRAILAICTMHVMARMQMAALGRAAPLAGKRRHWSAAKQQHDHTSDGPQEPSHRLSVYAYSAARRSLSAFPMTDTELNVIAALAQMGLINRPKTG